MRIWSPNISVDSGHAAFSISIPISPRRTSDSSILGLKMKNPIAVMPPRFSGSRLLSVQCSVRFRPCIDIHKEKVKQIVGSTLQDSMECGSTLITNFESDKSAAKFASLYRQDGLMGGHVIMLGADPLSKSAAIEALCSYPDGRYSRYTIEEIRKATNNLSDDCKIGEGGYGPVYKCALDHTLVAIKVLRPGGAQGMKQFQQEVEVLSSIRHPNMVLLLGACPEHGCLVYEYMANGSLEDRLFCLNNTPPLSWQQRFKIAAEIATGLLFLHQTKPEPLVHRDLKPGNILLDKNFVSKIADVGLARLVPPSVADAATQYCMTAAAGTFCYIDPEYLKTGMLGTKSDIYALGIILLQLVTGGPPMGITHKMEKAMEMDELEEMLDPSVPEWPREETCEFVKLALKCAELRRKDRPDLGKVVLPVLNLLRDLADESQSRLIAYDSR